VVLDAKKIGTENALVAKLEVPKNLTFPMGFHGFWGDE
jgi:9-cis-beta-carotene 9',10'-cleaving dioxygenase